tara:strand:+ start:26174 stop:27199 length:1026 start_codon:yes stop_codon:yes gene_type:complete
MMTLMEQEARQAPAIVAQQLSENIGVINELSQIIQQQPPTFVMMIARGSSDHAATFAKYLFESQLGWVTASAAPSIQTVYQQSLQTQNSLVIGISQSGQSDDICSAMQAAKDNGAITVALVNVIDSPLAHIADHVIPLHAGEEQAVAATKSYIASCTALIMLVARLKKDTALLQALTQLPDYLQQACDCDWSTFIETFTPVNDTLVCGRGFAYPIAQESALKFKETCGLHAESFSSAEVLHGPFALMKPNYPTLLYIQNDASLTSNLALIEKISDIEAQLLIAAAEGLIDQPCLPLPKSLHPICDPLVALQAFYIATAQLAIAKGLNPDQPAHLQKVTNTR